MKASKPFACPACSRRFVSLEALYRHEEIHLRVLTPDEALTKSKESR